MAKIRVLSLALILLAFVSIMCSSCSESDSSGSGQEDQVQANTEIGQEDPNPNDTGPNILTSVFPSPKEQNPFSVENMNETFKNFILENNANVNVNDIPELKTNFLYVRFLPYGKQGVYELKTYDPALALFKHPMDYNKIRKPVIYIDETLPDSIVPYFATVPVDYEFGPTPYKILQELFLTQPLEEDYHGGSQAKNSNEANKVIFDYLKSQGLTPSQLEAAVLLKAGKFEILGDEGGQSRVLAKSSGITNADDIVALSLPGSWRPEGTLKFYDELKGEVPLVGVEVTLGYFFNWESHRTDEAGRFRSPDKWTFRVDYEATFESAQFELQDGHSLRDWYNLLDYREVLKIYEKDTKSEWIETFYGKEAKWCVVWTAAYNYWKGKIYGLKRPMQKTLLSLDIQVYYKDNRDFYNDRRGTSNTGEFQYPILFSILVNTWESDSFRSDKSIYGTTIHEIAHSSHYENKKSIDALDRIIILNEGIAFDFNDTYGSLSDRLKETYAKGIERYLTIKRYGTWDGGYNEWHKGYTGLFEDLEDTNATYARGNFYCDKVSGITAPMAEKAVFNSFTWNHLKSNLMKYYPNGTINENDKKVSYTEADMNALFDFWEGKTEGEKACNGPGPNFKDTRDGYVYKTTKIGSQIWLAENLRYKSSRSRCYDDDPANCKVYGRLYNWAAAMNLPDSCNTNSCSDKIKNPHRGTCPAGWHIPTLVEWNKLILFVDGKEGWDVDNPYYMQLFSINIYKLLAASPQWIYYYRGGGTDDFGFSALPGGYYLGQSYTEIQGHCHFWGATEGGTRDESVNPHYNDFAVFKGSNPNNSSGGTQKLNALSIRCVKD
jgi:uncharacterized protein (TIGR02145 family)